MVMFMLFMFHIYIVHILVVLVYCILFFLFLLRSNPDSQLYFAYSNFGALLYLDDIVD